MKVRHAIRDLLIWSVSASGISAIYRTNLRKKGPLVRVIAFHDVENAEWFEKVIAMLVSEFNVITPEQFFNRDLSEKKINVLITFDDGYESWISNCLPVLQKHNIKAIFFVISGLVDIADDKEAVSSFMREQLLLSPKKALSWDGVRSLVAEGHTIGGHTKTHPDLAKLEPSEVFQEIEEGKRRVESEARVELTDFAYPFGRKKNYNAEVIEAVKRAGFNRAYAAETGFLETNENGFEIPRTLIEKEQPLSSIRRWIEGGYDIFVKLR